jgi:NADPH-dependent ferric siderophore reductase
MKAASILPIADAPSVAASLLDTFRDYAEVRTEEQAHVVHLRYGQATFTIEPERIAITAEAEDDIRLSYVKMAVAEHWAAHPRGQDAAIAWDDVTGITETPVFFQRIKVVASRRITPNMRRVTFQGSDFSRFAEGGLHVRLLFPPVDRVPVWPALGVDGRIVWPEGEQTLAARVYTLRRVDVTANEIDIDFVLHEPCGHPSPGAAFGRNAVPGDVIGIFAPGGKEIPTANSLLLLGDETALPAMARIVESLPETASARVFAEVDSPADHYDFRPTGNVEITYLYRNGRKAGTTGLLAGVSQDAFTAIRAACGDDVPFLWAGCELADYKIIRHHARDELKLGRDRHSVVAYWRKR